MANRRIPLFKAKILGLDVRDPGRYRGRSEPRTPKLGGPSGFLSEHARDVWECFRSEIPWLMESDRALVEIASTLRARLAAGDEIGVNAMAQLRVCLCAMGASPADRSKVGATDEKEDDPAAKFLN